ncbi:MAG: dihydrofolate reductase family protein [Acidimicrobiia bacterium]
MRTLIVTEFVTLDGVMEAPGGEPTHPHSGWVMPFVGEEQMAYKLAETLEAESMLLGRVTYEGFAAAWPSMEGVFADKMNSMPKHVASTTLREAEWNATVIDGDVPAAVAALKASDGGPILVAGSGTLVHTLLRNGLVDELRLMEFPVSIGAGLRVFPEEQTKLTWQRTERIEFSTGVTVSHYAPV